MSRATSVVGAVMAVAAVAATLASAAFEITPAVQREIDQSVEVVTGWAADPVVVKAVEEQNAKGPIAGLDNAKWKTLRRSDDTVKAFLGNDAAQLLKKKLTDSNERFVEAFLSAAQGEKVAFADKTTSYIHKGAPKFDVPFSSGKPWQGAPEFDESSQAHELQVSVPVLSGGKPIGVLVVGINLSKLESGGKS